eukprot:1143894-Pelagomonas_calceolata.AAC.11
MAPAQGPRDRLSESQRVWLKALAAVDVRAEVLRVREPTNGPGGKKQRRNRECRQKGQLASGEKGGGFCMRT